MLRRDFIKTLAASVLIAPEISLAGGIDRKNLPLERFNALTLRRDDNLVNLDLTIPKHYFAACYLLRDTLANKPAKAHPWLLHTAAAIQAIVTKNHGHHPLIVHSGYRTPETNRKVGGAKHSYHMSNQNGYFHAMDIHVKDVPVKTLSRYALAMGQGGVGIYMQRGFLHIDVGAPRKWDDF